MASLHKDPRGRSPFWYCAFTLPNGKRAFKSTKMRSRKDAVEVCRGWERASQAAGRGEITEIQIRKVLAEILESTGEGQVPTRTVRDFFSNWLEGKKLSGSKSTFLSYRTAVSAFLAGLASRADKPLTSLTPADIEKFRDARIREGVSASTVGQDVKTIRRVLNTARRQALILHNPAEAVELPRSKSLERETFKPDEVRAVLSVAPPEWKTAILAGYYTGQRLSDVISLRWDQVDLAEGVIFFIQRKTGKKVEVPIHSELLDHLLSLAGDAPHGLLCSALANRVTGGACGLSRRFEDLMNKAGVDRLVVQTSPRRRFPLKSFHSLRHSFASALGNAGVPADVRMKLTGHKSIDVHQRYSHLELEPYRKAIAAIPSLNHRD